MFTSTSAKLVPVLQANHARVMPAMAFAAWIQKSAQNQNAAERSCHSGNSGTVATMSCDGLMCAVTDDGSVSGGPRSGFRDLPRRLQHLTGISGTSSWSNEPRH